MARRRLKKCLHRPQVQYTWKASHCRLRWRRLNHNLLFYCFPLSSLWPSVETLFADPFVKTCRCRRCCSRSRCHLLVQPVKILSLDSSGQTQPIFSFFFVKPASSQRWTTNHRWSTAGWREFRWDKGSCTLSRSQCHRYHRCGKLDSLRPDQRSTLLFVHHSRKPCLEGWRISDSPPPAPRGCSGLQWNLMKYFQIFFTRKFKIFQLWCKLRLFLQFNYKFQNEFYCWEVTPGGPYLEQPEGRLVQRPGRREPPVL